MGSPAKLMANLQTLPLQLPLFMAESATGSSTLNAMRRSLPDQLESKIEDGLGPNKPNQMGDIKDLDLPGNPAPERAFSFTREESPFTVQETDEERKKKKMMSSMEGMLS